MCMCVCVCVCTSMYVQCVKVRELYDSIIVLFPSHNQPFLIPCCGNQKSAYQHMLNVLTPCAKAHVCKPATLSM